MTQPVDLRAILPSQEALSEMGRTKHTLPSVKATNGARPKWYFRAQIDASRNGVIERRTKTYYLGFVRDKGKRAAERERDTICAELNQTVSFVQAQTRLSDVLKAYRETYLPTLKQNSRISYETHLSRFIEPQLGKLRLCDVTPLKVQSWANSLNGSYAYRQTTVAVLRSVFEVASDWGYTTQRNPCRRVQLGEALPVQHRRALTAAEYQRMRAALPQELRVAADVAVYCGLRLGEILGLRRDALDYGAGTITVRRNQSQYGEVSTPKSRHGNRVLPMGFLRAALMGLCPASAPAETPVFTVPYHRAELAMRRAMETAGVKFTGRGWHCLRRMYATHNERLLGLDATREGMGHGSESQTRRYVDPDRLRQEAAMEAMREMFTDTVQ